MIDYTQIRETHFNEEGMGDSEEENPYNAVLITHGCGCCSVAVPASPENIQAAINSAEEFIAELKSRL